VRVREGGWCGGQELLSDRRPPHRAPARGRACAPRTMTPAASRSPAI